MAPASPFPLSNDLRRQIAELRFCQRELDVRCASGAHPAWLWQIKRRVASYFLHRLEDTAPANDDDPPPLNAADQAHLLHTHPLLHDRPSEAPIGQHEGEWMQEIRDKVRSYVRDAMHISERIGKTLQDSAVAGERPAAADPPDTLPPGVDDA